MVKFVAKLWVLYFYLSSTHIVHLEGTFRRFYSYFCVVGLGYFDLGISI